MCEAYTNLALSQLKVRALGLIIVANIVCILANGRLSMLLGVRQKVWLEAIQARITTTVASLGSIQGIKATGSTDIIESIISQLRAREIRSSVKYRIVLIALVTLCKIHPYHSRNF